MNRLSLITFSCLFLVMIGFSVAFAVLPLHVDRLASGSPVSREASAFHVVALTAVFVRKRRG